MPVALAVGVVAAAGIGAVASSNAASKAANASQAATDASVLNNRETLEAAKERTDNAIATTTGAQNQSYDDVLARQTENKGIWQGFRDSLTPYTDLGKQGAAALSDPNKAFSVSPDFNFRLGVGQNAVATNKSVNGLLKSGSALKAINNYSQNTAANEFSNWWARQQGLVTSGLTATGFDATGARGITGANDTISNADNSRAVAIGNAVTGGATNINAIATNLNNNTNSTLQDNATNQGNAALTQANATGNFAGSAVIGLDDLISKYAKNSTGSSYAPANSNVPWGDAVVPNYSGVVGA